MNTPNRPKARPAIELFLFWCALFLIVGTIACPRAHAQLTIANYVRSSTVAVTNGSPTAITCPLANAAVVQVYIKPSSTAQIYTITFPNGDAVEVPSGQIFTLRIVDRLSAGQTVFSVQTATGAANLQVIAFRETK